MTNDLCKQEGYILQSYKWVEEKLYQELASSGTAVAGVADAATLRDAIWLDCSAQNFHA